MRIALLTYDFPGARPSGIGAYSVYCASALATAGHDVHLFTLPVPADALGNLQLPDHLTVHQVGGLIDRLGSMLTHPVAAAALANPGRTSCRFADAFLLCDALRAEHRRAPFDIVEAPEVDALALPLLLAPEPNLPVVIMLHACTALGRKYNALRPDPGVLLAEALEFSTLLLAPALVAPTRAVGRETRSVLPALRDDITIIPSPTPAFVANVATHSDATAPFLFVGRLELLKGVHLLAQAATIFLRANPNVQIHLIGPDTNTAPSADSSQNSGTSMRQYMLSQVPVDLHDRFVCLGPMPPLATRRAIAGCRALVAPSLLENFSTVAAEALAAGRPVIYSSHTGTAETVAGAGLAVDPLTPQTLAMAMEKLYRDPALQSQLSARAQERFRTHLSVDKAVRARIDFYQSVITARPVPRDPSALSQLPAEYLPVLLTALHHQTGRLIPSEASYGPSPGRRLRDLVTSLQTKPAPRKRLYLYPAGQHTQRLLLERHVWADNPDCPIELVAILDDHASPDGTMTRNLCGVPILSRTFVEAHLDQHPIDLLVISSDSIEEILYAQTAHLRAQGIPVHRLYH